MDPVTAIKYPGVTSVVAMLPKPFLVWWAARMTAEAAVSNLPAVASIAERDEAGAVDYLRNAHSRYTKLRARIGSEAHDLFERMIRGEAIGRVHPDLEPYRAGFADFLDTVRPELVRAEDIAWSDSHEYAGSFDAILRVRLGEDGKPDHVSGEWHTLIVDWKTSKSTYPDVALQMAAYAHADKIIAPDGTSEPMPEFDGAAVLHITPDGWAFKPVRIDREVFDVFLTLRRVFTWDREISKTVLGRAIAESARRLITGTQRRA
ncbi:MULTISPECIES: hypothetical protein [Streptomyces]|uniref:hypothetical protein n=1 Tax=Streptomyces TaxID=1883 RepID=UPI001E50975B|nr:MULTISPECIES: hypothetical protein [Streptomyces]UFQ15499.1 hypothetical protein J2N69_11130 [Streptomyces huasconensis]WCL85102.1 hypothetical protein PPN52_11140 [Streptomyces sp. JCM 35825]